MRMTRELEKEQELKLRWDTQRCCGYPNVLPTSQETWSLLPHAGCLHFLTSLHKPLVTCFNLRVTLFQAT